MKHISKYTAKIADAQGHIHYTDEENSVWHDLIIRQQDVFKGRACDTYIEGLDLLQLPTDRIPQCAEVNRALAKTTGWSVVPVEALIPVDYFFQLLSEKKFPAASFIRLREELDYLQEPDIFHEIVGHCPLLTNTMYADFMQLYGKVALAATEAERKILGRLYWFTIEFGLINSTDGVKCYGGGILSSKKETIYAVESPIPTRVPFHAGKEAMRTPYRIDQVQPIYYVINSFQDLYDLFNRDIISDVQESIRLGDFAPTFSIEADTLVF